MWISIAALDSTSAEEVVERVADTRRCEVGWRAAEARRLDCACMVVCVWDGDGERDRSHVESAEMYKYGGIGARRAGNVV